MPLTIATREGGTTDLGDDRLDAFRARLRGALLRRGDPGFDDATSIWNAMARRTPALVVRCSGTADVVEAVNFARDEGLLLSIKGGGHNIAGSSLCEGGLTIDMSSMRGVLVDPAARVARAQGGCRLGDVDRETQVHGLAAVLGFVSETGIAGLTLGGGFGYLTRRFGWAVDNLLGVEIVTADGRVRHASREEEPDLFWALRGGSGNFGVVTRFDYRLHPVGPRVLGGLIAWPQEKAEEVLALYRDVTAKAPPELTMAVSLRNAPPVPYMPREWHGKPIAAIIACHTGSLEQARKDLAPVKGHGKPIVDVIQEKTYAQQQSMLDLAQPKGGHYYWKGENVARLDDGLLQAFRTHAPRPGSAMSQAFMFHLGDAVARRPADDGAVGNRDARYMVTMVGAWPAGEPDAPNVAWVREGWKAVLPYSTGGNYINFQTADDGADRIRAAYGANLARLEKVKATYDPDNLFRVNRNISPKA